LLVVSRIVVIGNSAGDKSTLSLRLANRRDLPRFDSDYLLWQDPGWRPASPHVYAREHAEIIAQNRWVIDGLGRQDSISGRLARSTEIILIDMPLWMHFWVATEWQREWARRPLNAPPTFPEELPPTWELFKTIWEVDQIWMPDIRRMCVVAEREGKTVTRLGTVQEIEAFVSAI
jgi:adenylate kinase family enzyme